MITQARLLWLNILGLFWSGYKYWCTRCLQEHGLTHLVTICLFDLGFVPFVSLFDMVFGPEGAHLP